MAAPVVPKKLAVIAPMNKKMTLLAGPCPAYGDRSRAFRTHRKQPLYPCASPAHDPFILSLVPDHDRHIGPLPRRLELNGFDLLRVLGQDIAPPRDPFRHR